MDNTVPPVENGKSGLGKFGIERSPRQFCDEASVEGVRARPTDGVGISLFCSIWSFPGLNPCICRKIGSIFILFFYRFRPYWRFENLHVLCYHFRTVSGKSDVLGLENYCGKWFNFNNHKFIVYKSYNHTNNNYEKYF